MAGLVITKQYDPATTCCLYTK